MEALPTVFASGWASGINAYLAVLVLGLAEKFGQFAQIPDVLATWPVLTAAGVMYGVEFVADKIPYVDSMWDGVSTAIRPAIGATLGVLLAGEAGSLHDAVGGTLGGVTALLSHTIKAGERLAVNTSPEPATNIGVSLLEDIAVLGVMTAAVKYPEVAATIAGILLILGLVILFLAIRLIRRGWRRLQRWRSSAAAPA